MRTRLIVLLLGCACAVEDDVELPEIVASSRYVDYGAWADVSNVCMDDRLALWDGYLEDVAGYLGVELPAEKIRYSWVPEGDLKPERWPCVDTAEGCAFGDRGDPRMRYVATRRLEHLHELVHSVELAALGKAHPVLQEGMAEYLSGGGVATAALDDFAADLIEILERDRRLDYYGYSKAMHFVGSIVEKHGIEQYLVFRSRAPADGGAAPFAAAYEEVFGESFEGALDEMSQSPVLGRWQPWGCGDGYESLPWPTSEGGTLEVTIGGACGDAGFYGGGFMAGEPGFSKHFTLDLEVGSLLRACSWAAMRRRIICSRSYRVRGPRVGHSPAVLQSRSGDCWGQVDTACRSGFQPVKRRARRSPSR
jgi:hypothetical protein